MLSGLEGEHREPRLFDSTYYDTDDRRLAREGFTLRRRVENGGGAWQLKLPQDGARLELEFEGGDVVPARVAALLVGLTRRRPLEQVASLRTHRETLVVQRDGSVLAEIVLDGVSVLEGERVAGAFDELEIELVDGTDDDLRRLERLARGRRRDGRGLLLEARPRARGRAASRSTKLGSGATPPEALRAALREQLARAARPRPRHAPRRGRGGSPPAARRDPAAARVPARLPLVRRRRSGPRCFAPSSAGSGASSAACATSTC